MHDRLPAAVCRPTLRPTGQTALAALAVVGLAGWMFWPVLWRGQQFAYRDAGHFYYPLFEYLQQEWRAGRLPLWNPYQRAGLPLAADGTASVWYPAKLLFLLPLSYDGAFRAYVILHVLLAAAAMFVLARHARASVAAAALAALAYAFGGSVLFQTANVVYLVGAAWLPLAIVAADRMLVRRSYPAAAALAMVLSLTTLGGDPQMAYNAGLIAALYAVILWRHEQAQRRNIAPVAPPAGRREALLPTAAAAAQPAGPATARDDPSTRNCRAGMLLASRPALLAAAALAALALAAIQVVPSAELLRHSTRARFRAPRSLYELASAALQGRLARSGVADAEHRHLGGLLAHPEYSGPGEAAPGSTYAFSVGPWRWAEFLWPNVFGRSQPINRRWIARFPAEASDPWVPSLYLGIVPVWLALWTWRDERCEPLVRLCRWLAAAALLAACGVFGAGYFWRLAGLPLAGGPIRPAWGDPCGGLAWFMNVALPGYIYFRFPGKWLVVAACAIAVLAARGFDRACEEPRRLLRGLVGFAAASLTVALLAVAAHRPLAAWLAAAPAHPLFGPLDVAGALADLLGGLVQGAAVALLAAAALRWGDRGGRLAPGVLLVVLTAADLAMANGWLIASVPAELLHVRAHGQAPWGDDPSPPPCVARIPRQDARPEAWRQRSSSARLEEIAAHERDRLVGKHAVRARVRCWDAQTTFALAEADPRPPEQLVRLPGGSERAQQSAVVVYEPGRVVVEAALDKPGPVVLCEQFFPGWQLEATNLDTGLAQSRPLQRTSDGLREAWLPAGRWRLEYRYRPLSFRAGAAVTAAAWSMLGATAAAALWLRVRRRD